MPGADEGAHTPRPSGLSAGTALHLHPASVAWIGGGLLAGLVGLAFLRNVPSSLTQIGVGVLLALALDPLVVHLRSATGLSRLAAVALVGTGAAALAVVLALVLGPPALDQAGRFGSELPETVAELYDLPLVGDRLRDADAADRVREWAADLPASIDTESVTRTVGEVVDGLVNALVVVVIGVSVLVDGDRIVSRARAAVPDRLEDRAVTVGRTFYRTVGAYFSGSVLVAVLAATVNLAIGLAFGLPLAPAAALWTLVVNLIPQVGGLLAGGFLTMLALTQGVQTGLIVAVLYVLYMNLENHVIAPAIVGHAVDLSPPSTMLAALVGGAVAGVPGALVATPFVGAAKSLYLQLRWGIEPSPAPRAGPATSALARLARLRGRDVEAEPPSS